MNRRSPSIKKVQLLGRRELPAELSAEEVLRLHPELLRPHQGPEAEHQGEEARQDDEEVEQPDGRGLGIVGDVRLGAPVPVRVQLQRDGDLAVVVLVVEEDLDVEVEALRAEAGTKLEVGQALHREVHRHPLQRIPRHLEVLLLEVLVAAEVVGEDLVRYLCNRPCKIWTSFSNDTAASSHDYAFCAGREVLEVDGPGKVGEDGAVGELADAVIELARAEHRVDRVALEMAAREREGGVSAAKRREDVGEVDKPVSIGDGVEELVEALLLVDGVGSRG